MLQRLHFLDKPSGCNGLASTQSPSAVHHVRQQPSGNWQMSVPCSRADGESGTAS